MDFDYSGRDSKSYMLKHSLESNHEHYLVIILIANLREKYRKRCLRPLLNTQEKSVSLLLRNN